MYLYIIILKLPSEKGSGNALGLLPVTMKLIIK